MFVEVHAVQFGLSRQAESPSRVDRKHHDHRHGESCCRDAGAANHLCNQHLCAAAVEEALEQRALLSGDWSCRPAAFHQANSPNEIVPQMRGKPWTGTAPMGSINCAAIREGQHREDDQDSGDARQSRMAPVGLTQ